MSARTPATEKMVFFMTGGVPFVMHSVKTDLIKLLNYWYIDLLNNFNELEIKKGTKAAPPSLHSIENASYLDSFGALSDRGSLLHGHRADAHAVEGAGDEDQADQEEDRADPEGH